MKQLKLILVNFILFLVFIAIGIVLFGEIRYVTNHKPKPETVVDEPIKSSPLYVIEPMKEA